MNPATNEPVLTANGIVAAISTVITALLAFGIIKMTPEQQTSITAAIVVVVGIALPLVAAWWARAKVTPLVDPKVTLPSGETVPLVRADNQQPTPQALEQGVKGEKE